MVSRNPCGVENNWRKGDIRTVVANNPRLEVVAHDHPGNEEDMRNILCNAEYQNRLHRAAPLAKVVACTHRTGSLEFYAYQLCR